MTIPPPDDATVEETLKKLYYIGADSVIINWKSVDIQQVYKEAELALDRHYAAKYRQMFDEVIGEDEVHLDGFREIEDKLRNGLRAELRQALVEKMKEIDK